MVSEPSPRIESDPSDAALEVLARELFAGRLAPWAGSLSFREDPDAIGAEAVGDPAVFADLTGRFARAYPGAEHQAVVSFWSQHYFAKLAVVVTAFCLAADRPLGLDYSRLRIRFCSETGTPRSIHLRGGGPLRTTAGLVKALYEEQLADVVARLKERSGLSARLFWENAGAYGIWIIGEFARTQPDLAAAALDLLADPQWPHAGGAVLHRHKQAALQGRPSVRRVCCLRYRLPGVAPCAGTCPLARGAKDIDPQAT